MPTIETNTRKVIRILERDGWVCVGGTNHDKFEHPTKPGLIVVPRHRELSPGVAKTIAKTAGWI